MGTPKNAKNVISDNKKIRPLLKMILELLKNLIFLGKTEKMVRRLI